MPYREDDEFMAYVGHLIEKPSVQRLKGITHHIHSNRLEHSINVSYTSYKIAKNLAGMPAVRHEVLFCMIYFIMTGAKPSLKRVMLGYIPA